jgi:hypothetical protein
MSAVGRKQIAVGIVGGGIPLLFLYALFILLGELTAKQREATTPISHRPACRKGRAPAFSSRHEVIANIPASNLKVRFTPESGHVRCNKGCPLWAKSRHVRCN